MNIKVACIAVCALASGGVLADTIDASYTGIAGGSGAAQVRVEGRNYYAGHMNHTIESGDQAGEHFATFCIDFSETAIQKESTYEIIDLAQAPKPGTPYGQTIADSINAVVANAAELGWIDNKLQANTSQQDYLAKMGAIQAAIWEAFGSGVEINSSRTNAGLASYYHILMDSETFDSSRRVQGLRAMVAEGQQDMLVVVPLPPAALAGLGMLGSLAGVRAIRRRA